MMFFDFQAAEYFMRLGCLNPNADFQHPPLCPDSFQHTFIILFRYLKKQHRSLLGLGILLFGNEEVMFVWFTFIFIAKCYSPFATCLTCPLVFVFLISISHSHFQKILVLGVSQNVKLLDVHIYKTKIFVKCFHNWSCIV